MGLPDAWKEIEEWMDDSRDIAPTERRQRAPWTKKNPEIPVLKKYDDLPGREFWKLFPRHYPTDLKSTVDVEKLKQYVSRCWESWTLPQKRTALRAVSFLSAKKPTPLLKPLPGLIEKNAPSAIETANL